MWTLANQIFRFGPTFPVPAKLKTMAKWPNFFDGDDVLGYPLKPLSTA
jgi:hypothetical protein